jgi:hypothetical protein
MTDSVSRTLPGTAVLLLQGADAPRAALPLLAVLSRPMCILIFTRHSFIIVDCLLPC